MNNPVFGRRLRELREARLKTDRRFTLRYFAALVGVSPSYISKIETGKFNPPSRIKILRMAEILDVDEDEFLALAGKVRPSFEEMLREQPEGVAKFLRVMQIDSEMLHRALDSILKKNVREGTQGNEEDSNG